MSRELYLDSQQMASFMHQYVSMLEMLLNDLRGEMRGAVDQVMDQVSVLDVATQSVSTLPASRQAEVLTERQEKIDQIVMEMMGVMSSGDVIKQQVEHIAFGFAALSKMLEEMLARKTNDVSRDEFDQRLQALLKEIKDSFTMESEHECLKTSFNL